MQERRLRASVIPSDSCGLRRRLLRVPQEQMHLLNSEHGSFTLVRRLSQRISSVVITLLHPRVVCARSCPTKLVARVLFCISKTGGRFSANNKGFNY